MMANDPTTETQRSGPDLSELRQGSVEVHAYPSTAMTALLSLRRALTGGSVQLHSITPLPDGTVRFNVELFLPVQLAQLLRSVPEVAQVEQTGGDGAQGFRVMLSGAA
jgi:hypothetical protein